MPKASLAVTVKAWATPAMVGEVNPDTTKPAVAAGLTTMPVCVPVMPPVVVSVAVNACVPAVLSAVVKEKTPASPAVNA